jgi:glyoxylate utilization-related uncharacterized protein
MSMGNRQLDAHDGGFYPAQCEEEQSDPDVHHSQLFVINRDYQLVQGLEPSASRRLQRAD